MLAHRRSGAGAGHVRAAALSVDQTRAVTRDDGLPAQHVALLTAFRLVVVDGQRAEDRGRLLLAVAQVRLLADEVLRLHARRGHAGLDDVVLGLQLVAMSAVALLEAASSPIHADAARGQAVRPPGLPQRVPQQKALLHRHVQLPAQVADVRDPRGEDTHGADVDGAARAELEPFVRDVV